MKPTLHQFHVFKTVADLQSVSGAAQILHMTQPAVSNLLKQLELALSVKLTEIVGRKLHLTQEGQLVLTYINRIQEDMDEMHHQLSLIKGKVSGCLKVACVSTAKYFMPALLGRFKKRFPDVMVLMSVGNRFEIIERLKNNQDDFVIMSHLPEHIPVNTSPFFEDKLVIVSSIDNPLSQKKQIPLHDLESCSWIIREEGSGTRIAMLDYFKKNQFTPRIDMQIGNNEAIKQLVIAGLGISMISRQSIETEISANQIAILDVIGLPINHKWQMVRLKNKHAHDLVDVFYTFVRELFH